MLENHTSGYEVTMNFSYEGLIKSSVMNLKLLSTYVSKETEPQATRKHSKYKMNYSNNIKMLK